MRYAHLQETIGRLRELQQRNKLPWVEARDYSHEKAGSKGVACDEWETFIINPGSMSSELAELIAAALNALPDLLEPQLDMLEFQKVVDRNEQQRQAHLRALDVALNGEDGAARAPLLIDILSQVTDERWKLVRAGEEDSCLGFDQMETVALLQAVRGHQQTLDAGLEPQMYDMTNHLIARLKAAL